MTKRDEFSAMSPARSVPRVFLEALGSGQLTVTIGDSEAHHLLNVLRLTAGDPVELFDGQGTIAVGVIDSVTRRSANIRILSRRLDSAHTFPRIVVAAAPPKGERLRWMVEKLTEIGVEELILLETRRTVVQPGDAKLEKLKANVVSACKQCGRSRLMTLQSLTSLEDLLTQRTPVGGSGHVVIAHPELPLAEAQTPAVMPPPSPGSETMLLVGPEGGFTAEEVALAVSSGAQILSWPTNILRIETAAVVFAAQLITTMRHA